MSNEELDKRAEINEEVENAQASLQSDAEDRVAMAEAMRTPPTPQDERGARVYDYDFEGGRR